jgi:hypothetical protein
MVLGWKERLSARSAAHDAKPGGLTAGRASQIDPKRSLVMSHGLRALSPLSGIRSDHLIIRRLTEDASDLWAMIKAEITPQFTIY